MATGQPRRSPVSRAPRRRASSHIGGREAVVGASPPRPHRCGSPPTRPTRAELCGGLTSLRKEKDRLEQLAASQRDHLEAEALARHRLHALAAADVTCQHLSRHCLADLVRLQAGHLAAERRRLERELAALQAPACQHGDEKALREELAAERQARLAAEEELRAVEADLVLVRSQVLPSGPPALGREREGRRREGEEEEDEDAVRQRLRCEVEARRREARDLWVASADFEVLQNEFQEATNQRATLRAGLARTLRSLEQIQSESGQADQLVEALPPSAAARTTSNRQPPSFAPAAR